MGLLVDGEWKDQWYDTKSNEGRFKRKESVFRNWVTADGSSGPSGKSGFKAEPDRYHLYVSYACPWAHRALIYRSLKGLEDIIPVSVTHWYMAENGWTFDSAPGVIPDPVNGADFVYNIYQAADPEYTGRCTVPILWDKKQKTMVSNESADIIRMFNSAFDGVGAAVGDYYPADHQDDINQLNEKIYHTLNNGVYKCGFATSQKAYDEAIEPLFDTMDWLEQRLSNQRYLIGNNITEADLRLFPTLYRFDAVYIGHFKCSVKRLMDYPNLWAYARDLFQFKTISGTVNMDHARKHYYESHDTINPSRIVPRFSPLIDFSLPHDRDRFGS